MLIFIGPTAAGKTTLMRSLCNKLRNSGKKCLCFVSEPFGGLAYMVVALLSRLLLYAYRPSDIVRKRKCMAIIEILNPSFLSKLLPLILTADIVSTFYKHMTFLSLEKLGFTILVEDYIPQMLSDHLIYTKLYNNSKISGVILEIERRMFANHINKFRCIRLDTEDFIRMYRESLRSGDTSYAIGFYNNVVRGLLTEKLCRCMGSTVIHLRLELKSLRDI